METLVSKAQVAAMISYSKSQIDRWESEGKFPKRFRPFGSVRVVWVRSEVQKWIDDRIAERSSTD